MHHFLELTDHFYVSLSSNSYMSISLGSVSGDVVCSFWGSHFPFLVFQNFALASKDLGEKKKKQPPIFLVFVYWPPTGEDPHQLA